MSVNLPPEVVRNLRLYHELLLKWQKAVNLIAPSTVEESWERHFEDSLQLLGLIPDPMGVLVDMGSGGGFPGLVLAIAKPSFEVHLIESDQKKCTFLLTVSRETGVQNVHVHHERLEFFMPNLRASFVTARALAPLGRLIGYARPQWERAERPATLIFLKGEGWQAEVSEARKAYDFSVQVQPSTTQKGAAILCISDVRPLRDA